MKKNSKVFAAIYICVWYSIFGTFAAHLKRNETSHKVEKTKADSSAAYITRNERNRRLIPYATYYVAGGREHSNSIQTNPITEDDISAGDDNDQLSTPRTIQRPVNHFQKPHFIYSNEYRQDPVSGYSYIPIAYIPGVRGINYNSDSHYYPNSYYHSPIVAEDAKMYTTGKPKYATSTPSNSDKKGTSSSYFNDFASQQEEGPANSFFKYLATPVTNSKHISQSTEMKKPTYHLVQNSPVLFTTPLTDYLNFRYSDLYKTQRFKYDYSTTPPTVEITSPKHYIVANGGTTTPTPNHLNQATTPSYPLTYENSDNTQYSYSAPSVQSKIIVKPIPSPIIEQSTQSSKTLMTIMKSHEFQYQPGNPKYTLQYSQKPSSATDFSVDDIFKGYNINKQLPERITSENIKESIRTLSYILQILKKADSITQFQKDPIIYSKDILESLKESPPLLSLEEHKSVNALQNVDIPYSNYDVKDTSSSQLFQDKPLKDEQNTPGRAGIDYPVYSIIPQTTFTCKSQRYKGFFADPDTKCQVWHYCDLNGGQASFLCPNGTIFNQAALTCDWWFNVKCASTPQLYVLNERLYKYIIPVRPSFPEDYSGPLVDQYLTEKFREIESKRKYRYPTNTTTVKTETNSDVNLTSFNEYDIPTHLLSENL